MHHFSLVVPTLNEVENIEPLLSRISAVVGQAELVPEIIFVDDGSQDGTRERIAAYIGPLKVRLICRDTEKGLTGAVIAGARAAEHDPVVVMDCDLSHPPEALPSLLTTYIENGCDMVLGSRYAAGGETLGWPLIRRWASLLASVPARLLTGVRDPLAGFFVCSRTLIGQLAGDQRGFKIALALLASGGRRLKVMEVPIAFRDRHWGKSKMKPGVIVRYLRQIAGLVWHRWFF